jgi:hypothetical protein
MGCLAHDGKLPEKVISDSSLMKTGNINGKMVLIENVQALERGVMTLEVTVSFFSLTTRLLLSFVLFNYTCSSSYCDM